MPEEADAAISDYVQKYGQRLENLENKFRGYFIPLMSEISPSGIMLGGFNQILSYDNDSRIQHIGWDPEKKQLVDWRSGASGSVKLLGVAVLGSEEDIHEMISNLASKNALA